MNKSSLLVLENSESFRVTESAEVLMEMVEEKSEGPERKQEVSASD